MTVQYLSPAGMLQGAPYHHVAVATGATQVHVAGQVGQPGNDPVAANDLAAQVTQCLRNTSIGLALPMPPSSLIGVESLYAPDVLVEVEATAVLP